jgi:hypothetical protein
MKEALLFHNIDMNKWTLIGYTGVNWVNKFGETKEQSLCYLFAEKGNEWKGKRTYLLVGPESKEMEKKHKYMTHTVALWKVGEIDHDDIIVEAPSKWYQDYMAHERGLLYDPIERIWYVDDDDMDIEYTSEEDIKYENAVRAQALKSKPKKIKMTARQTESNNVIVLIKGPIDDTNGQNI